jgi:hypothetical protein
MDLGRVSIKLTMLPVWKAHSHYGDLIRQGMRATSASHKTFGVAGKDMEFEAVGAWLVQESASKLGCEMTGTD